MQQHERFETLGVSEGDSSDVKKVWKGEDRGDRVSREQGVNGSCCRIGEAWKDVEAKCFRITS